MTASTGLSALVRALETMPEELAIRLIPEERSVMLLQVSKTMRTAMHRVRPGPPAMIKVKQGQRTESVELENAILDMMKCCRITAIHIFNANMKADGVGRLAPVLGQCASLAQAHLNLGENEIGADGAGRLAAVAKCCLLLTIYSTVS